ncbi:MAG: aminotransferase class IV [Chloroflexota bacterium]
MAKVYYVNGDFVPADEAHVPVTDLAVLRGYGVFDFFRTYGGKPIQLERNINRLRNSANMIELDVPWSNAEIAEIVLETLNRNGFEEANIRIIVTGGDSPDFITPQEKPRLLVYVEPLKPLPEWWYTSGVKVITVKEERQIPRAKSLNYISAIIAQKRARKAGAVEALYVDRDDNIREGTTTNLFAFYGENTVITPQMDILPGVTRGRVIELLSRRYEVLERPLSYDVALTADELVITAANKQVVPVVQLDGHVFGGGQVGHRSKRLMDEFQAYVMAQTQAQVQS